MYTYNGSEPYICMYTYHNILYMYINTVTSSILSLNIPSGLQDSFVPRQAGPGSWVLMASGCWTMVPPNHQFFFRIFHYNIL